MISKIGDIAEYLLSRNPDPVPEFIIIKEIKKEPLDNQKNRSLYERMTGSKWYLELSGEQWANGSWGRFHTQDTKSPLKQKMVTTEGAIKRARELSLDKNDPVVSNCIKLMERYLRDEEKWTDANEKHFGFNIAFKTIIAANLSLFNPDNPLINHKREACAKNLSKAFEGGFFNEVIWEQENIKVNEVMLRLYMVHPLWLLQYRDCIDDELQRHLLEYIWNRKEGIYYISNLAPSEIQVLESPAFGTWLSGLEVLSGFSLFAEFMQKGIAEHLFDEINRLINDDVSLPSAHSIFGHYSESWRIAGNRKNDMIFRILRLLVKSY